MLYFLSRHSPYFSILKPEKLPILDTYNRPSMAQYIGNLAHAGYKRKLIVINVIPSSVYANIIIFSIIFYILRLSGKRDSMHRKLFGIFAIYSMHYSTRGHIQNSVRSLKQICCINKRRWLNQHLNIVGIIYVYARAWKQIRLNVADTVFQIQIYSI
jgi:hypothetical protein